MEPYYCGRVTSGAAFYFHYLHQVNKVPEYAILYYQRATLIHLPIPQLQKTEVRLHYPL